MEEYNNVPLNNLTTVKKGDTEYTIVGNEAVEERGKLNTKELAVRKLKEILEDPFEKIRFERLTPEEKEQRLIDAVVGDYRIKHNLTSSSEQIKPQTKEEAVTKEVAKNKQDESILNQEIGVVKSDDGTVTVVHEEPDGTYNISETNAYSNGGINTTTTTTTPTIESDTTYLSNDQSEIINESSYSYQDNYTNEQNNNQNQNERTEQTNTVNATLNAPNNSRRLVRRLEQPNRGFRPNGYIQLSIISTILILATILGLIIGSTIYLYTR